MRIKISITLGLLVCLMMFFSQSAFVFGETPNGVSVSRDVERDEWLKTDGWESNGSYVITPGNEWALETVNIKAAGSLHAEENTILNGGIINAENDGRAASNNKGYSIAVRQWGDCELTVNGTQINSKTSAGLLYTIGKKAKATLNGAIIDGTSVDRNGAAFIETANNTSVILKGSIIQNVKNSAIQNNGSIEFVGGTTTIKDSGLTLKGNAIVVGPGATLVLDGSTLNGAGKITLRSGATLKLTNASTINVDSGLWIPEEANVTAQKGSTINLNNGGWIDNKGTLTIDESSLNDNNTGLGEAILNGTTGVITITDSNVTANNRKLITNNYILTINGASDVKGAANTANPLFNNLSGSVMNVGGTTNIHDHNKTGGSDNGGVIYLNAAALKVTDNPTFQNNKTNDYGGVVRASNGSSVDIGGGTFSGNNAEKGGGAIRIDGGTLTIADGAGFKSNRAGSIATTAAGSGGALYLNNCATTIGSAAFEKNGSVIPGEEEEPSAGIFTQSGGAIYAEKGSLEINGAAFSKNIALMWDGAQGSGGAIHATGTEMVILGSAFTDNAGQLYGGAISLGTRADAFIGDLEGEPSSFTGNAVLYGAEFAGGAICIHGNGTSDNDASLRMEDAAIYNNSAEGAGGGISTCQQGTSRVLVMDGAAIYDNTVGDGPVSDAKDYSDIYIFRNGKQGQDNSELYERMFNGGLHNWKDTTTDVTEVWGGPGTAKIARSNPTNKDISKAKVIFTGNKVTSHPLLEGAIASGGAISNNGLLKIGRDYEIKIVKAWDDAGNQDGKRPADADFLAKLKVTPPGGEPIDLTSEYLQVTVVKEGEYITGVIREGAEPAEGNETVKLSDKRWMIVVSGLEDAGPYRVEEEGIDGYTEVKAREARDKDLQDTPATDADSNYFAFTNQHIPELCDIEAAKAWDDEDDKAGLRPKTITIKLYADGEDTGKALELGADNKWKGSFTDLPRFSGGKEIKYTVEEVIKGNLDYYTTVVKGSTAEGFVITNSLEFVDDAKCQGTKTWVADEDVPGKRPSSITVRLLENGKAVEGSETKVTPDSEGKWSYRFNNLPKYKDGKEISYSVEEVNVPEGYTPKVEGLDLTNTYTGDKPEDALSIKIRKAWDDENDRAGLRPKTIAVKLYADGKDTGKALQLSADNEWKGSFTGLPKSRDGKEIKYTVEEVIKGNPDYYSAAVKGSAAEGFVITNTYTGEYRGDKPEETSLKLRKEWDDRDDADGLRPDRITIRLTANGERTGDVLVLREEDDWQGSFDDLPVTDDNKRTIEYGFTEDEIKGYTLDKVKADGDVTVLVNKHKVNGNGARTGDDAPIAALIGIFAAAAAAIAAIAAKRRKRCNR